jgi:hypothetical protein
MIETKIEDQALSPLPRYVSNNCVIYHITKPNASNFMKLEQRLFAGLLRTEDAHKGLMASAQRRKPEFKGK